MDRKEELHREIQYLTDVQLFAGLKVGEAHNLEQLMAEYRSILEEERKAKALFKKEKSRDMKNRGRRGRYGEKRVAKQIGGRVDGRAGKKDVRKGMFYFEVKSLKKTPKFNDKVFIEACRHCPTGQIAVAVIRNTTDRTAKVIMDWEDFVELHGKT